MKTKAPWMRPGDEGFPEPPGGTREVTTDWKQLFFDLARDSVETGRDPSSIFRVYAEFEKHLKRSRRGGVHGEAANALAAQRLLDCRAKGDKRSAKEILRYEPVNVDTVLARIRRK